MENLGCSYMHKLTARKLNRHFIKLKNKNSIFYKISRKETGEDMIKWSELDKNKYYYVFVGVQKQDAAEDMWWTHWIELVDLISAERIQLTNVEFDVMVKDDSIGIIGLPENYKGSLEVGDVPRILKIKNQGKDNEILIVYCNDDEIYETDERVLTYEWDKEVEAFIGLLYGTSVEIYKDEKDAYVDKYTVLMDDINDTEDLELHSLVLDGIEIQPDGGCGIASIDKKCISVPNGVRYVKVYTSNIEELILPKSCKKLIVYGGKIGKIVAEGLVSISMGATKVGELNIGNSVRRIEASDSEYEAEVGKIVGQLKLYGDCCNQLKIKDELGVLDFSKSVMSNCECCMLSDTTIYPEGLAFVTLEEATPGATLEFNGYVEYLEVGDSLVYGCDQLGNEGITIRFNKGASAQVLKQCELADIELGNIRVEFGEE